MRTCYYHFPLLDSTNSWAKREAIHFDRQQLTIVSADRQTAGRGRRGRSWQSPDQNLYCSFCLFVEESRADFGNFSQLMALSAALALESLGYFPQLKWPNDIQIGGRKVGGILTETIAFENDRCLIIGIGINVGMSEEEITDIDQPATSLSIEGREVIRICELLRLLEKYFLALLASFLKNGITNVLPEYRKRLIHQVNSPLHYSNGSETGKGTFMGINDDGTLAIKLPNGKIYLLFAGEVYDC